MSTSTDDNELSPVNKPFTIHELAYCMRTSTGDLRDLMRRHGIQPSCSIAGVPVFGRNEVRRLVEAKYGPPKRPIVEQLA